MFHSPGEQSLIKQRERLAGRPASEPLWVRGRAWHYWQVLEQERVQCFITHIIRAKLALWPVILLAINRTKRLMWRNVTFKCHPETAAFFELLRATGGFVSVPLLFYFFLLLPQAWRCFWREFPLFFLGAAAVKLLLIPDATITTPRLFSKRYQRMLWQQSFRVFSLVQKEKKKLQRSKSRFPVFLSRAMLWFAAVGGQTS